MKIVVYLRDTEGCEKIALNLLPPKFRETYECAYQRFIDWCKEKNIELYSEDVLMVYLSNLANKMKSSPFWSQYSMLWSTLDIKNEIDISKYSKLREFLKTK